jgi:hypothetical protein
MNLQSYLDLIPDPNNQQPNFMAWVEANIQPGVDAQTLLDSLTDAFGIDTAVGVQLDILGALLGRNRTLEFQPGGGLSAVMDDGLYRVALRSKIIQNQWKGTKQEIYDFWQRFFPETPVLIQDNQDMSMSIMVVGMVNDTTGSIVFGLGPESSTLGGLGHGYWSGFIGRLRDMVKHGYFTPKPAGVAVNYSFLETSVFALGIESTYLKGLGQGNFVAFS